MAATTIWVILFKNPGNRRRAMIMICLRVFAQLSGNGLVSYHLIPVLKTIGITDSSTQTITAGLFNEWGDKAAGTGVILFLFIFYIFYKIAFNALVYSYLTEVWPFATRAKGVMILHLSAKCADFVNAMVNPIGLNAIGCKFYSVYIGWLVI
jgi:hypothetical protein